MDNVIPMKQWLADTTSNFFSRPVHAPIVNKGVMELGSRPVITLVAGIFEPYSRDLNYISEVSRVILVGNVPKELLDEADVLGAEDKIEKQIMRVDEWFDARLTQSVQRLESLGVDAEAVLRDRSNLERLEVQWTHTHAKDMVELALKADRYYALNFAIWSNRDSADRSPSGKNDAIQARLVNERDIRHQLYSVTKVAARHFTIIHRICKEVQRLREEQRQQRSERDRAAYLARQQQQSAELNRKNAQRELDALNAKAPPKPARAKKPRPAKAATPAPAAAP